MRFTFSNSEIRLAFAMMYLPFFLKVEFNGVYVLEVVFRDEGMKAEICRNAALCFGVSIMG